MARFTVEADGGSRGNPGPAGYGAVVRDAASGEVLREVAASIGSATNNVAEYRGLIAGLKAALELDPSAHVEVRMDSKLVVEQMSGRWQVRHTDMRVLAAEASALVRRLGSVAFRHVPRERNQHADRLANEAMDAAARGRVWRAWESAAPAGSVAVWPQPSPWLGDRATQVILLLARHGATTLSGQGRFCGITDVPLSPAGERQAERLADALVGSGATAVVSSPLQRCAQTARAVGARLGCPVESDEDLRETDFGAWEGLTLAEVAEGWADELAGWRASADVPPPTGESLVDTDARVRRAVARLAERHAGARVVVVSHVTPIKLTVLRAVRAAPEAVFGLHVDTASLTRVDILDDSAALLRTFNDTAHLG